MRIYSAKTMMTEKWVHLSVSHETKAFTVSVRTKDGVVQGTAKSGLSTSYINYFHEVPEKIRQKHFEQVRAYVEKYIR